MADCLGLSCTLLYRTVSLADMQNHSLHMSPEPHQERVKEESEGLTLTCSQEELRLCEELKQER